MSWPTKKLKNVCSINGGDPAPQDYAVFSSDGIPFVRMQDLGRYHVIDNLTETRDKIKLEAIKKLGVKIFSKGSIILPRSGSVFANHRAILGIDAVVVSHIAILNNYKDIQPKYLFWYLTKLDIGRHAVKTSNVDSISFQRLGKFEIPIPPLQIQKQIVERLDKIAEAQKLNSELIQKTDELFQSLLHKELNPAGKNWEIKKLVEVANIVMGQSPPSSSYNEHGKGLPFFQGKAEFGEIYPIPVKYCSSPNRIAEANDILISVRAPVGNINIAKEKSCVGRGLGVFRAKKKILNQMFLFYFMKKNENNWSRLSTGSTFSAIKGSNLRNFEIVVPPLKIQKQIVAKLSAVQDYKKQLLEQKLKLKELFDSVLNKSMNN